MRRSWYSTATNICHLESANVLPALLQNLIDKEDRKKGRIIYVFYPNHLFVVVSHHCFNDKQSGSSRGEHKRLEERRSALDVEHKERRRRKMLRRVQKITLKRRRRLRRGKNK